MVYCRAKALSSRPISTLVLFSLLSAFTYLLANECVSFLAPKMEIKKYSPSLLVTINCGRPNCERAKEAYRTWGSDLVNEYPSVLIKFVSTWGNSTPPGSLIRCKQRVLEHAYRQIFYNNYQAYHYFLSKSKKEWIFRTTEDVYVQVPALINLLRRIELTRKGDAVFVGQIIMPALYAHGGPGWIMNREGAELWVHYQNYFGKYFEYHKHVGDDVIIDEFQRITRMEVAKMHTNLFFGYPVTPNTEEILDNKQWDKFGPCPQLEASNHTTYTNIKEVAVWHSGTKSNYAVHHGREVISGAPDNLSIMHYVDETIFCYQK